MKTNFSSSKVLHSDYKPRSKSKSQSAFKINLYFGFNFTKIKTTTIVAGQTNQTRDQKETLQNTLRV